MDRERQPPGQEDGETSAVGFSDAAGSGEPSQNRQQNTRENEASGGGGEDEEDDEDDVLKYGAEHVIQIFVPVSICMLVVVTTVSSVYYYTDQSSGVYLFYTPFHPSSTDSAGKIFGDSLLNALIVLAVVVVMTVLLVLLYKFKFYKVIHGWLILSTCILMFVFSYIYLEAFFKAYNMAFDYITLAIFVFNFGCMGMISLHWKAPLLVQQFYHIIVSALLGLVFIKYLPDWTLWAVLAIIAIWDLIAVLCPHGPLRILVNLAHERNENIFPALIYSSTVAYIVNTTTGTGMATETSSSEEGTTTSSDRRDAAHSERAASSPGESAPDRPLRESSAWTTRDSYGVTRARYSPMREAEEEVQEAAPSNSRQQNGTVANRPAQQQEEEDENRGVKLGLGDFIFYGILVGKAASYGDWPTTIAAYIAILMGLFFTLLLLAIFKKALPALPISIAFGLVFTFGTQNAISPFINTLAGHQVFI